MEGLFVNAEFKSTFIGVPLALIVQFWIICQTFANSIPVLEGESVGNVVVDCSGQLLYQFSKPKKQDC